MTTIEDWVETYCVSALKWAAIPEHLKDKMRAEARAGLLAVIEKHIGPLVADAFSKGSEEARAHRPDATRTQEYTARILSALTATGRE